MQELTVRILERNLRFIEDYRLGTLSLASLIKALEGAIAALEERLPDEFSRDWYESWRELEISLALNSEGPLANTIQLALDKLTALILGILAPQESESHGTAAR